MILCTGTLFGNLKIVGQPVGLFKNIGGGVMDFFYEVGICVYMMCMCDEEVYSIV